ncbi:unnamed protein product [Closterium sp. NIES-65]|nr:unnamed protein product [Closterium sp. NIES-65]
MGTRVTWRAINTTDTRRTRHLGFSAYRFSISWPRILPSGRQPVNQEGVEYYNRLIHCLLRNGITPCVTLFHWHLPQALEEEFGGFRGEQVVGAFREYARLCFSLLGDRVPYWLTFNEPYTFALKGYAVGDFAPGRCSDRQCCAEGDGAVEPYVVVHHMLLAHAAAVDCYRREFQPQQGGQIGIPVDSEWAEPFSQHPDDVAAADRRIQFSLGWLPHPIFFGTYAPAMHHYVGPPSPPHKLPRLKAAASPWPYKVPWGLQTLLIHITTTCGAPPKLLTAVMSPHFPLSMHQTAPCQAASPWLYEVPWGFEKLLMHITTSEGAPPIYITEKGTAVLWFHSVHEEDDQSLPLHVATSDPHRVWYYHAYLSHLLAAIMQGADVRGYIAWSWMDNFEWQMGYSRRFGLVHVDRTNGLKRTPKTSATWWQRLLSGIPVHES